MLHRLCTALVCQKTCLSHLDPLYVFVGLNDNRETTIKFLRMLDLTDRLQSRKCMRERFEALKAVQRQQSGMIGVAEACEVKLIGEKATGKEIAKYERWPLHSGVNRNAIE